MVEACLSRKLILFNHLSVSVWSVFVDCVVSLNKGEGY